MEDALAALESDSDEDGFVSAKKEESLEWTAEQQQLGVDILFNSLEHDLSEEAEPPEVYSSHNSLASPLIHPCLVYLMGGRFVCRM